MRPGLAFLPSSSSLEALDDTLRQCRFRERYGPSRPVIRRSATVAPEEQAAELGVAGYLEKPSDAGDLIESVERYAHMPTSGTGASFIRSARSDAKCDGALSRRLGLHLIRPRVGRAGQRVRASTSRGSIPHSSQSFRR